MTTLRAIILTALSLCVIATPLLAQDRERLSRECRRDVVKVCGRDRSKVLECLQSQFPELKPTCQDEVWDRLEQRLRQNRARNGRTFDRLATMQPSSSLAYGSDERQKVDFFAPQNNGDESFLIMHIHGGGWSIGSRKAVDEKPLHFTGSGYAFASTGYRLLPDAQVEQQAADIGRSLRLLREQASELGINSDRIVIMGHSAGAHLAALIGTDPKYAGTAFDAIEGVILLDGAAYNIPAQLRSEDALLPRLFKRTFGDDVSRQRALSPITHVGGGDAPNWLILFDADRAPSGDRSKELGNALERGGKSVEVLAISNTNHGRLNSEIGTEEGSQQTRAIDSFLAQVLR
ncbi:MAG: alpha/beta hydrolase [Erythrobacter sp.]|uniref:alpha/beta hydrolase n=1 Tax=Erythrobacter sp. TaxID=1042 RepID=UPI003264D137